MRGTVAKRLFNEATKITLQVGIKSGSGSFAGARKHLYKRMKADYKARRGAFRGR